MLEVSFEVSVLIRSFTRKYRFSYEFSKVKIGNPRIFNDVCDIEMVIGASFWKTSLIGTKRIRLNFPSEFESEISNIGRSIILLANKKKWGYRIELGYSRKYPHPLWTTLNWVPKNFRISKKDSSCLSRIPTLLIHILREFQNFARFWKFCWNSHSWNSS